MLDTATVHMCDFHHPQKNLPASDGRIRGPEAEFADRFADSYRRNFRQIHAGTARQQTLFVREVPVSGSGIADLLVLSWDRRRGRGKRRLDPSDSTTTIRAFEVKLSDWRGGLMQAHRCRFFSNASVLVLPKRKLRCAESHLDLFRALHVGLWGFDESVGTTTVIFTPRPKNQSVAKYRARALMAVEKTADL